MVKSLLVDREMARSTTSFWVEAKKGYYATGRFAKQFNNDQHRFNVMQTAVLGAADSFEYTIRNGYTWVGHG